ncbi:hypothetical protein [Compostibacter hankyongensis]
MKPLDITKKYALPFLFGILLLGGSCTKDYFVNGGTADPHYDGSIYDYLANNPYYLDTVAWVVAHSSYKEILEKDSVTFFSFTDDAIRQAMDDLNDVRYYNVEDSVHLEDIPPEVWDHFLGMYIMRGRHLAKDFARVDPLNIYAYPGINYVMYNGYVMNIGLLYQDYNGVEAVGARILQLTDITYDPTNFRNNSSIRVASSDIQPVNGVLHVLNNHNIFGFRGGEFARVAEQNLVARGK